jgi:hypothetical protein
MGSWVDMGKIGEQAGANFTSRDSVVFFRHEKAPGSDPLG